MTPTYRHAFVDGMERAAKICANDHDQIREEASRRGLLQGMAVALLPALAIWGVVIWGLWG